MKEEVVKMREILRQKVDEFNQLHRRAKVIKIEIRKLLQLLDKKSN